MWCDMSLRSRIFILKCSLHEITINPLVSVVRIVICCDYCAYYYYHYIMIVIIYYCDYCTYYYYHYIIIVIIYYYDRCNYNTAPAKPGIVHAVRNQSEISVMWSSVSNVSSYTVYWCKKTVHGQECEVSKLSQFLL